MQVRIRMYRMGIGDCFLLTFRYKKDDQYAEQHMLIDCGIYQRTDNEVATVEAVVKDIREAVNDELLIILATHEHYDHLCGFKHAWAEFEQIKTRHVWLGWLENPNDDKAVRFSAGRRKGADQLLQLLGELDTYKNAPAKFARNAAAAAARLAYVSDVLSFSFGVADNQHAQRKPLTQLALDNLRNKKGAQVKYCYPGNSPICLAELPGIRFYVLGPPTCEQYVYKTGGKRELYPLAIEQGEIDELIDTLLKRKLWPLPESGSQEETGSREEIQRRFAYKDGKRESGNPYYSAEKACPFNGRSVRLRPIEALRNGSSPDVYREVYNLYDCDKYRQIDDEWMSSLEKLALKLDSATNNTSLAIAIELTDTGEVLLFPGDAQVGNWLSWFDLSWTCPGSAQPVQVADLLNRTIFYKVGHHGSHNATLRHNGLELMNHPNLMAAIPVNQEDARKKKWEMPFGSILERLKDRTRERVICSDHDPKKAIPAALNDRCDAQQLYIDLFPNGTKSEFDELGDPGRSDSPGGSGALQDELLNHPKGG